MDKHWDIIIIGGGPGGYVAAIRGAQLGKRVLLVEKDRVGGTCMNWGCIPTKYLLHQSQQYRELKENRHFDPSCQGIGINWASVQKGKQESVDKLVGGIEFLLNKNGVYLLSGYARLISEKEVAVQTETETVFTADAVVLATGSRPAELPFLQSDGEQVITSRQALSLTEIPKRMLVVGAGAIGLEMGTIFSRLGSDVTILEILPNVLPGIDRDMALRLERLLKKQGLKICTQMKIESASRDFGKVVLKGIHLKTQSPFEYEAEKVLLAAGRHPNSENFLEVDSRLDFDCQKFLKIDGRYETGIPNVYAIGDLIGGRLLAHKASHEGTTVVENICGKNSRMNTNAVPSAVFTEPEFAMVGMTETEAVERGLKIRSGHFSLQANGRALTLEKMDGLVKILSNEDERIIGAQILSPHASEIISEVTLAIQKGLKLKDISTTVHIHPTLSESIMEAALNANNEAIHMLNV
jgi:dihydrolipoamide dehydrogenase